MKNESHSAKRPGPKSSAQTPAKKSEQKKGSSKNKPGSAGEKGSKITFSDRVLESLKMKVKEHNAKYSKKVTLSQLKKKYIVEEQARFPLVIDLAKVEVNGLWHE